MNHLAVSLDSISVFIEAFSAAVTGGPIGGGDPPPVGLAPSLLINLILVVMWRIPDLNPMWYRPVQAKLPLLLTLLHAIVFSSSRQSGILLKWK
jgi:hypothetical protein